jgi:hypothetical protein
MTAATDNPSSDLAKLARLISLPFPAKSAYFETAARGAPSDFGPTDYALTAVITFSDEDAAALVKRAAAKPAPPGGIEEKSWFSADVKKRLATKARRYDASAFFKGALANGSVTHLEGTPTFVLSLFTM